MKEDFITKLEQEKDHLEKVIKVVRNGGKFLRRPGHYRSVTTVENIRVISRNLDKLIEQVQ